MSPDLSPPWIPRVHRNYDTRCTCQILLKHRPASTLAVRQLIKFIALACLPWQSATPIVAHEPVERLPRLHTLQAIAQTNSRRQSNVQAFPRDASQPGEPGTLDGALQRQ
jgi:hypothetical protein